MATLEKIRSKSVFLFIIIIVALLAFILGDFLTSGRSYFGTGTTMYSAGSEKVDYNEYQNQASNLQGSGQDAAQMEQVIMQSILMQKLLEEQYKKLGINITDAEISKVMLEQMPASQQLAQAAQQLGLPSADRTTILDAIKNPTRYGLTDEYQQALQAMWKNDENNVEETLKQRIFFNLVDGLFTANQIDAQALYNDNMSHSNLTYVSAPVSVVADDQVEITDADLKAKYDEIKSEFFIQAFVPANDFNRMVNPGLATAPIAEGTRSIDYVVVEIQPSAADLAEAETEVSEAVEALRAQNALEGIAGKGKFTSNSGKLSRKNIADNQVLKELSDSDLVDGTVTRLKFDRASNTHTIVKVLGHAAEVDSINISIYAATSKQEADSLLKVLGDSTTIEQLLAKDQTRGVSKQWNTLVGAPADIKERLLAETVGKPFVYGDSASNQYAIYQIDERKPARQYYEIALVTYTVDPSATTVNDLRQGLNSFIASNSNGDLFSAKADSLYNLQHAYVSGSSARIGNVQDTRRAVKWAMNAKPGQVSKVFETPREFLAIAVKEVYDNEYVPYNSPAIKDYLTAEAKKSKKAQKMVEQYAGKAKDINGYANLMKSEVHTDSAIVFGMPRLAGHAGASYALQGRAAAAKPGELVGPFQNDSEVVVFVVDQPKTEGRAYEFAIDGKNFTNTFGINFSQGQRAVDPVLFNLLVGDRKVKNNSLKFVADEEQ